MKKTLNAILCVMLVALMGVAAPLLILFSAKQTDTPAVSDGFDAVYADEEEDDLSGLAADALYTVNADIAGNGYARATSLAYSYSGYKSYTSSDISLFKTVPNKTIGGLACTAMQGMNVGTTYIYTVKIHKDEQRAERNGNHNCITQCFLRSIMSSCANILSSQSGNCRQHG